MVRLFFNQKKITEPLQRHFALTQIMHTDQNTEISTKVASSPYQLAFDRCHNPCYPSRLASQPNQFVRIRLSRYVNNGKVLCNMVCAVRKAISVI